MRGGSDDGLVRGRPYIAVVGAGEADARLSALAEEIGRLLARAGALLVCGGLGGVMEAACRGARSEGGATLGILPGTDRAAANPHVDVSVATGLGEARNALLVRTCDALIAVGGEFGTLSEIAFALKTGKPVVGLETWELAKGGRFSPAIARAANPQEAVAVALRLGRGIMPAP